MNGEMHLKCSSAQWETLTCWPESFGVYSMVNYCGNYECEVIIYACRYFFKIWDPIIWFIYIMFYNVVLVNRAGVL